MGMIRRLLAGTLTLVVLLLGAGCERAPDDEMVSPAVTESASPKTPRALPDLPTGRAGLDPAGRVVVEGAVIRARAQVIDVSPLRVDEHVVTPGGIYFVNRGELWFTDLVRLTPTPFSHVRGLELSDDGGLLVFVDLQHGAAGEDGKPIPLRVRYRVATGEAVDSAYVVPTP